MSCQDVENSSCENDLKPKVSCCSPVTFLAKNPCISMVKKNFSF